MIEMKVLPGDEKRDIEIGKKGMRDDLRHACKIQIKSGRPTRKVKRGKPVKRGKTGETGKTGERGKQGKPEKIKPA
jgi:hypothetical protein